MTTTIFLKAPFHRLLVIYLTLFAYTLDMYNKPYGQLMNAIRPDQTIKKTGDYQIC